MPPRPPYGMIRPDTERIAIMAAMNGRRNATWPHLWPEVVGIVKGGDSLHGKELTALHDYLVASGRFDLTDSDVQVVQFSRDWAASVLGGHDQRASRAIRQLQEIGLLELAAKGEKGHASGYAVMPLPPEEPDPPP